MDMNEADELLQDLIERRASRIDRQARAERAEAENAELKRTLAALVEATSELVSGGERVLSEDDFFACCNTFGVLGHENDCPYIPIHKAIEQARAALPKEEAH